MRGLQWLSNKKVLELKESVKEQLVLGNNGKRAVEKGLPEKIFLENLDDGKSVDQLMKDSGLNNQEVNVCIGLLRKKKAIHIENKHGLFVSITDNGKKVMREESKEEKLLKKIGKEIVFLEELNNEEKSFVKELKKRKEVLKTVPKKDWHITLTNLGKQLVKKDLKTDVLEKLTPELLRTKKWQGKKFRKYDVGQDVPSINRGKKHFVNQATDYIKKVWLDMGFEEMTGTIVQTSLWNFDALFTAQDHPVRELQDTFFIKNPGKGTITDKKLMKEIKTAHETGKNSQSRGWRYKWSEENAKKNVLRTHTTCLSAQTIRKLKAKDLPRKFFAVGKNFRNETMDWSHLFELTQVEGIVVDRDANFKNLIGYLKEFYKKLGFEKIRIRPAYFPYTEPSMEIDVYHPIHKKWVELGGSGIFRPEVVIPLFGEFVPVLAWGQGLERGISEYFNIHDIRELYNNDLKKLREMKEWMK